MVHLRSGPLVRGLALLAAAVPVTPLPGQGAGDSLARAGVMIACPQSIGDTSAALAAPRAFLDGEVVPTSTFELNFTDSVPAVAEAAITFAASIWESYLASDVPVVIDVDWVDRDDDRLLASAGPTTLFRDFPGALPDVWYPVALAESIVGEGLNDPGEPDIDVIVNSEVDWYFGTDLAVPPGQTDLVTVALHELGHGLGFISSADTIRGVELVVGFSGRFIVYDTYLQAGGRQLVDTVEFDNPGELLFAAVTGADLAFAGPTVLDRNAGEPAPLFAPAEFDVGSSVSHFDEAVYPTGTREALMTPALARGEAIHDPGPLAIALLSDLGWDVNFELSAPPSDLAEAAIKRLTLLVDPRGDRLRLSSDPLIGAEALVVATDGRVVARSTVRRLAGVGLDLGALARGVYVVVVPGVGAARFFRS